MTSAGDLQPRRFALYLSTLILMAVVALWRTASGAFAADPWFAGAAFVLLSATELGAVSFPGGGYVSAGAAIDIAALIVLGPAATAWINFAATLLVQGAVQRRPPLKVAHNIAAFVLTAIAAGAAFAAAGGRVGALDFPRDLGPMAACAATYFAMNSVLVSLAIGFTAGGGPWRAWQRLFGHSLLYHAAFLALGALLALVTIHSGPWGLALFALPFFAARHAIHLYVGIRRDLRDFVRALAEVLDEVDPYTRQHSLRVAEYSVRLARGLRCSERLIEDLECAALVHDLGKISPQHQRILQKAGTLTHEDQRTLRGHPATGAGIIGRVATLRRASEIVRLHHERPDGRGYPLGLRSDQVPLGARILNVADAFDAMTSDRPYRRALDVDVATRELDRGAGSQFDGAVVECLLRLRREGRFAKIESPSSEELQLLRIQPSRVRV